MALRGNSGLSQRRAEKRREYTRASSSLTSEVRQVRVTRLYVLLVCVDNIGLLSGSALGLMCSEREEIIFPISLGSIGGSSSRNGRNDDLKGIAADIGDVD